MECHKCKRSGIKLWRQYNSWIIELTCYQCSGETRAIDKDGGVQMDGFPPEVRTYQICGSLVPAVPVRGDDSGTYWGYTSIPEEDAKIWKRLPN